ncbi:MAG: hypothetical protein BAJATHORv1_10582 [Candidatus Thorarchaeota archaeon]|nr:MAG: hypothetical protein BAJATHORv1_10582 [Candidatus Thorarchaeota archaeon]
MSFTITTHGSCFKGLGKWSYELEYISPNRSISFNHSDCGEASGTTTRQMKLNAILQAVMFVKSSDFSGSVVVKSDCKWCVKCLTREYDCVSDDKFKRDKVARGYVQFIREIWWKIENMDVRFEIVDNQ